MSVLIKGMEMPDGCVVCPFFIENHHDRGDDSLCRASGKEAKCGCPLIPIPPHGRLIDADALDIKRREEQAWHDYERNPDDEYLEGVKDGLHEAAKQLSVAPTIIEAEVSD